MRKVFWLRVLLVLGLLFAGLVPVGAALAAGPPQPFSASGPVLAIDQGTVFPAGLSGRFVVAGRTVTGTLSGDLNGPFTFVYRSNVPVSTQSGAVHGTLSVGGYGAAVRGQSSLVLGPGIAFGESGPLALVLVLGVTGSMAFTDGAQGQGDFTATVTVAIDPATGHILGVVPSGLPILDPYTYASIGLTSSEANLSGTWHQ